MEFNVTIDNWTLQSAVASMNDCDEYGSLPNREYIHLLEAVILWDNINYINNAYSFSWSTHADLWNIQDMILEQNVPDYERIEKAAQDFLVENSIHQNIVTQGAVTYAIIGQKYGIDIMLTDERAAFLSQLAVPSLLSRKNLLDVLDSDLNKFYNELYDKIGYQPFSFRFPVLIDYMRKQNGSYRNLLKMAKEMHDSMDVVSLRAAINALEKSYTNRNLDSTIKLLKQIPDISESILSGKAAKEYGDISISLPFSISISRTLVNKKNYVEPGFLFLKTLSSFGTKDRLIDL